MIHKSTIYLLLLLFCLPITAQNTKYSLLDSTYDHLSEKYYEYKFTDSITAKKYAELFLKKAQKNNDTLQAIDGYYLISDNKNNKNIFLNHLDSLIKKTIVKPNRKYPTYIYLKKGYQCLAYGMYHESLKNYISAIEYSILYKNDSAKYVAKLHLGGLKVKNKNYADAKKIYLELHNYYKSNPKSQDIYTTFQLLLNISHIYLIESKYDSAYIYNKKALKLSIQENDTILKSYALFRDGNIKFKLKKYQEAINSFNESLSGIILDESYNLLSSTYNNLGESYYELDQKKKSLKYYLLIDSLYQRTNITSESQKNSYTFLINYFKEKKDLKKQLLYIEKLIRVDSILNSREKNLAKTFNDDYDVPKLKAEKEKIISQLKGNLNNSKKYTFFFFSISILVLLLLIYQIRKKKILKQRFDKFIIINNDTKSDSVEISEIEETEKLNITKDIVENVLIGLKAFEKNNKFKDPNLSIKQLAANLNTNSNYLSKIINQYKNKNFSKYLKELRINYSIELINNNEVVRKYTIKAIAKEVGFNTPESFAIAFHKKTGLKPSYYIKELNKRKKV